MSDDKHDLLARELIRCCKYLISKVNDLPPDDSKRIELCLSNAAKVYPSDFEKVGDYVVHAVPFGGDTDEHQNRWARNTADLMRVRKSPDWVKGFQMSDADWLNVLRERDILEVQMLKAIQDLIKFTNTGRISFTDRLLIDKLMDKLSSMGVEAVDYE